MTDSPTLYHIPAVNFPRLEREIKRINKRATRLETKPVTLKVHDEERIIRTDSFWNTEYEEVFFVCSVEGAAPQVEGYRLIAVIQPIEGGENLVREVPGEKCPQRFRTSDMICEHCNVIRQRNSIFIMANEFGEYRRIGRNCLQDYLGGISPESLLGRAEYMMDFADLARNAEESEWGYGGSAGIRCVPINQFVITCSAIIQKLGWMSRSKAYEGNATADIAWDICTNPCSQFGFARDHKLKVTEADKTLAERAVEWASKIKEDAPNNYLYDVGVCCRQQYVTWDRAGYVGSVLQAYQQHIEEFSDLRSSHVGTVDKRCKFADVNVSADKAIEADSFGPRRLIIFTDPNGNILNWFTSKTPEWVKVGDKVTIEAYVKKHNNFRGVDQTLINRVMEVEEQ